MSNPSCAMFKSNVPHPRGTLVPQPPHAPAALPPGFRTLGLGKERFEVPGLFRVLLLGTLKSGSHFVSAILCQPQSAISPTLSRTGIGVGGRVGTNSHTPPPICPPPRVWGWLGEGISPDMAKFTTFHSLPPKRQFHASASLGKFLWDKFRGCMCHPRQMNHSLG